MTKFAIIAVELDGAGEVARGKVHQIVGGNRDLPSLSERFRILDRIALVDVIDHGDQLAAGSSNNPWQCDSQRNLLNDNVRWCRCFR
jgi:hypothetical protein